MSAGYYVADGTGELPSISDFEERYAGEWESFDDYARELAGDIGLLDEAPGKLKHNFIWKASTRYLAMYYTTTRVEVGVYVFRSYETR